MGDADPLPPLSEAQLEIMQEVWDRGEATVSDVWKGLSARRGVARNTVLTMLERLAEKGWLLRDEREHAHRYRAAVPREETLGAMVRRLVETAFAGSTEGLISALFDGRRVSAEEAGRIKEMIDRAERGRP